MSEPVRWCDHGPVTLAEEERDAAAPREPVRGQREREPETQPLEGRRGTQPGVAPGGTCALYRSCFHDVYGTHVSDFATARGSSIQGVHFLTSSVTR